MNKIEVNKMLNELNLARETPNDNNNQSTFVKLSLENDDFKNYEIWKKIKNFINKFKIKKIILDEMNLMIWLFKLNNLI